MLLPRIWVQFQAPTRQLRLICKRPLLQAPDKMLTHIERNEQVEKTAGSPRMMGSALDEISDY